MLHRNRLITAIVTYAFLLITAVSIFLPLNPRMPRVGIDSSYQFALNQAVAQHLRFGKQIAQPYGPYATVCDRAYHPVTYARAMAGSLLLGFAYCTALLWLNRRQGVRRMAALALFAAAFTYPDLEVVLISFPLLVVLCALQIASPRPGSGLPAISRRLGTVAAIVLASLGLLPLIKDSLILPFLLSLLMLAAILINSPIPRRFLLLLLLPIASLLFFWILAGQLLTDLPGFFQDASLLSFGFIQAMALSWGPVPQMFGVALTLTFLLAAALFCSALATISHRPRTRAVLAILSAAYLLLIFKLGFVRSDHAPTAFAALSIFALLLGSLYPSRKTTWSLAISSTLVLCLAVSKVDPELTRLALGKFKASAAVPRGQALTFAAHMVFNELAQATYGNALHTYTDSWHGVQSRIGMRNSLASRYDAALLSIRDQYAIHPLSGTTDIYMYDQSILLASTNRWNPRPVIQSYQAYTPILALRDAYHLRGSEAPDWVLFKLETIDHRYPSLDDGLSWPALMDNYTLRSFDGTYAYLQKKPSLRPATTFAASSTQTETMGHPITLPPAGRPLFAEITAKPTLLGHLAIILFKPPQLHLTVTLRNGETQTYRVNSNMMTTGFVLSPLVKTTQDFAQLESGSYDRLAPQAVTSLTLASSFGGSLLWKSNFDLTMKQY